MMEKYRTSETRRDAGTAQTEGTDWTRPEDLLPAEHHQERLRRSWDRLQRIEKEQAKRASRRKWSGLGLMLLGMATGMASCPFYEVSLIGPETVLAGLGMMVAGGVLVMLRPKLKETTHALMIAMKHDNVLTVTRLALEMDVSIDKAEQIIRELVKSDLAEIDLDHKTADDALVYRIKGL